MFNLPGLLFNGRHLSPIVFWGMYSLFIIGRKSYVNVSFPVNIEFSKYSLFRLILFQLKCEPQALFR